MSDKKNNDYPDYNLSAGELIGIVFHLWTSNLIQCHDKEFIKKCLGLDEFDKKHPIDPENKITVDQSFMKKIVDDGYKMIIKSPKFFQDNQVMPHSGIMVVIESQKRVYCVEESVNYLRNLCNKLSIEMVEENSTEPTYFFRMKS